MRAIVPSNNVLNQALPVLLKELQFFVDHYEVDLWFPSAHIMNSYV